MVSSAEAIEKESFRIIKQELMQAGKKDVPYPLLVYRLIHTTADFEWADTLRFSCGAVEKGVQAIKDGCDIITDTNMALAGINKNVLKAFGGCVQCFMADEDVAKRAKAENLTRAVISMRKAAALGKRQIFAIGNAPTALLELCTLIQNGFKPALVIGLPVGFVNVMAAKHKIQQSNIPYITNESRKGGSNVVAAACNALLYMAEGSHLNV